MISRVVKVEVGCYQQKQKAEANYTYQNLDNSGSHEKPNSIIVL